MEDSKMRKHVVVVGAIHIGFGFIGSDKSTTVTLVGSSMHDLKLIIFLCLT